MKDMTERQLIEDLLSALEYHTEQTRPIQFSTVAIEFAREYLRKPEQPAQQDIPDLIAGALGVSRGTAYDMMREALAEQPAQQHVSVTDELVGVYCKAWEQSFTADNPYHTVSMTAEDRKHIEAGLKAAHGITKGNT
jgi:hypothetical protein